VSHVIYFPERESLSKTLTDPTLSKLFCFAQYYNDNALVIRDFKRNKNRVHRLILFMTLILKQVEKIPMIPCIWAKFPGATGFFLRI
jgi:hypothetical protein